MNLDNNALKELLLRKVEEAKTNAVRLSLLSLSTAELPQLLPPRVVLHPALQQSGLRGAGRHHHLGPLFPGRRRAPPLPGHAALPLRSGPCSRADAFRLGAERPGLSDADQRGRNLLGVLDPLLLGALPGHEERLRAEVPRRDGVPGRGGVAHAGDGAALAASVRSAVDAAHVGLDE